MSSETPGTGKDDKGLTGIRRIGYSAAGMVFVMAAGMLYSSQDAFTSASYLAAGALFAFSALGEGILALRSKARPDFTAAAGIAVNAVYSVFFLIAYTNRLALIYAVVAMCVWCAVAAGLGVAAFARAAAKNPRSLIYPACLVIAGILLFIWRVEFLAYLPKILSVIFTAAGFVLTALGLYWQRGAQDAPTGAKTAKPEGENPTDER